MKLNIKGDCRSLSFEYDFENVWCFCSAQVASGGDSEARPGWSLRLNKGGKAGSERKAQRWGGESRGNHLYSLFHNWVTLT